MVRWPALLGLLGVASITACGSSTRSEPRDSPSDQACDPSRLLGVGDDHACAVTETGEVACWGAAFGNGTAEDQLIPVLVPGLVGVRAVTAGRSHSCALLESREVVCWGTNESGQLGDGTTVDRLEPAAVSGLANVRRVSAGGPYTCALTDSDNVLCTGSDDFSGATPATVQTLPSAVSSVSHARALSVGGRSVCALLESGAVACWGWTWLESVGVWSAEPTELPGIAGAVQVSAGLNHDCLVLETGAAACRGYGRQGQLGDGNNETKDEPVPVLGLADIAMVAAGLGGYGHTCAIRQDGTVSCWGINTTGQLGNSSTESAQNAPGEPVLNLEDAVAIDAGAEHTCALRGSGEVTCWGKGERGQLGHGSTANQGAVAVSGLIAATCP
jgi:alpha-tubulin suppressor-like RCC1 family protein